MIVQTKVGDSDQYKRMSDEALIQAFTDGFLQGNMVLLSNQQLRTETLRTSMQLMSVKEGCIAAADVYATPISIMVRYGSSYGRLLHERLLVQSFYPLVRAKQQTGYHYRFCETPEGYNLHCTTAKDLWRTCWGRGARLQAGIPMDLLVWRQGPVGSKETWYSLKGMDCQQGQLILKMLGWSDSVDSSDLVVWAQQRSTNELGKRSVPSVPSQFGIKNSLPFRN